MPPKRKAAKASKNISVKEQDAAPIEKKARVDDNLEDATNINEVEETPAEPSTDNSDSYGDRSSSSAMAARFKKLQELKRRRV
jgi:hypothetical protein